MRVFTLPCAKRGRRYNPQPRCGDCCRFMSWPDVASGVAYTPYGGPEDIDPPDERYFHRACWNGMGEDRKRIVRAGAWLGPTAE